MLPTRGIFAWPRGQALVAPATLLLLAACFDPGGTSSPVHSKDPVPDTSLIPLPHGFPKIPYPADNPPTAAKIELGRRLFYETGLSRDRSISCATCHRQEGSFADPPKPFTFGIDGHLTGRNSPSLANLAYAPLLFADGAAMSLEEQAAVPIQNPLEMDMDTNALTRRLDAVPLYRNLFRNAWGDSSASFRTVLGALASFERSLLSGASPYDRWKNAEGPALSESARRGETLFSGKAACNECHSGFLFTDRAFHNTGLDTLSLDPGRAGITGIPLDSGRFKTPSLRNIALSPPYMHDGRFLTLRKVIDHYNSGGLPHPDRDPLIRPLGLTEAEITDLSAFLESLTDTAFAADTAFSAPATP